MVEATSAKKIWEGHALAVSRKVNFAWWMQEFAGPLLFCSLLGTCILLLLRREHPTLPVWQFAVGAAALVSMVGLAAWFHASRRFENPAQSLVRMEAAMSLRSALSAASAKVAPWPEPPARVHAGLRWNWPRLLIAPLAALLMLIAGLFIPMSRITAPFAKPDEPQAWSRTEAELEKLEQEKVIDEPYIEEVRKKIEDLRAQDPDEWFSHASMEATDNMRKEHKAEAQRLERDMSQAAKALGNLQKNPDMGEKEKARLANEFEQALDGMKNGAMKPNPALLEQLKGLDPGKMGQLTPEQMQQLKENLQKQADKLGNPQQGEGQGGEGEDWMDELLADGSHPGDKKGSGQGKGEGEGGGEGEGAEGEGPGKGGVNRGPGHAPNLLGKASQELETGDREALKTDDLSRALPGDLLELQDGEHEVDKSASGISSGGAVSGTGKGGERVWKESLDPNEQKALKKYFK